MAAGYGENTIKTRFNNKWGNSGYCLRLPQHKGDPEAISDLIAGISGRDTFSIEVKRITRKPRSCKSNRPTKVRALGFTSDFSITTRPIEYPHQLERQVILCGRAGWIPVVLLQVVTPRMSTDEYLFRSADLYDLMKNKGLKSVPSDMFAELHRADLYDFLFRLPPIKNIDESVVPSKDSRKTKRKTNTKR
jgi:hypothetical protein